MTNFHHIEPLEASHQPSGHQTRGAARQLHPGPWCTPLLSADDLEVTHSSQLISCLKLMEPHMIFFTPWSGLAHILKLYAELLCLQSARRQQQWQANIVQLLMLFSYLFVTCRDPKTAASWASCVAIVQLRTSRSARCALLESTSSAMVDSCLLKSAECLGDIF